MYRKSAVVEHETDYGRVSRAGYGSRYWVTDDQEVEPQEYGVPDEPVAADELDEYDHAVKLATSLDSSNEKIAELWAVLAERFGKYGKETIAYDPELRDVSAGELDELSSRVPIAVAKENKPVIAAYLAAHGVTTGSISRMLEVGESTVEQYVSDVRRGSR